jgi:hypothetical protein
MFDTFKFSGSAASVEREINVYAYSEIDSRMQDMLLGPNVDVHYRYDRGRL